MLGLLAAASPSARRAPAAAAGWHADAELVGAGGEDPFDVLGVGEQHPGAEVAQAQREGVAVALPALLEEGQRLAASSATTAAAAGMRGPGGSSRSCLAPSAVVAAPSISSSSSLQVAPISSSKRSPVKSAGRLASAPRAR